jgi:hypothetical protein
LFGFYPITTKQGVLQGFALSGFYKDKVNVLGSHGFPIDVFLMMRNVDAMHFKTTPANSMLVAGGQDSNEAQKNELTFHGSGFQRSLWKCLAWVCKYGKKKILRNGNKAD